MWIIDINEEEPITSQGPLDEIKHHQTPRGKSKFNISLCRKKSYQRTDIEDIFPDLINSDLWFHISEFVSQRNLSLQITLVNSNSGRELYL